MSAPTRLAAFATVLVALFALGLGAGRVLDPDLEPAAAPVQHGHGGADDEMAGMDHGPATVAGLARSADGYTLDLSRTTLDPGRRNLSLTITGPDGHAVTDYDTVHDKQLHLIVVRRDLTGFQHVHPSLSADGTWTVPVDLRPGAWRVVADFAPSDGGPQVLGTDLAVAGRFDPRPLGPDVRTARVDGYDVALVGDLTPGEEGLVTATVTRGGEPVTDLQPYLGAYGHLVMLRAGDLGYVHVHPEEAGAGPDVPFRVEVPEAGTYRLFLDFRHDGRVRTATFTVRLEGAGHEH